FGGLASAGHGAQQVTWSWNGSSWTLLQPDTSPLGAQAVMGYDESTRQMILLTQDRATWEWAGTNWKELQIAGPPFGAHIGLSHGTPVTIASVVRAIAAIDAAFCSAGRVTLAGSTIPDSIVLVNLSLRAS